MRRRPAQPYRQFPNLDLAPPELRRRLAIGQGGLRVLLVIILAVAVNYPLYRTWAGRQGEISQEQARAERLNRQLPGARALLQETEPLKTGLDQVKAALGEAEKNAALLQGQKGPWGSVYAHLLQAVPPGVSLSSLNQAVLTIGIEGTAPGYNAVVDYQERLVASPLIAGAFPSALTQEEDAIAFTMAVEIAAP